MFMFNIFLLLNVRIVPYIYTCTWDGAFEK